jgi:glutaminyl-tRNA synthetase
MRAGEFPDGAKTLRAKIDMASANMNLRDPVMYRILHAHHHRTGAAWCIYPMYDWAHGQSDALEGITHSLCSLEFENHRPLYDWYLDNLSLPKRPRQIEFARLQLTYTVTSKRKLQQLVKERHVSGWDDPRMPTLRGLRRRGYTPEAIRNFVHTIGVARFNSTVDMLVLENALRDDLNRRALRRFAVLDPIEVVIENYPEGQRESVPAVNNPEDPQTGTRPLPFERRVYIDREDFREEAPKGYFRLKPGGEVRLRYAYVIKCERFEKDASGRVTRIFASYDPLSGGGQTSDGRKVKGIVHWLPASQAMAAEVRLYDHLFKVPEPGADGDLLADLNPHNLTISHSALVEKSAIDAPPGTHFQFERVGYFVTDLVDHRPGRPVFNRAIGLKDTWAKLEAKG